MFLLWWIRPLEEKLPTITCWAKEEERRCLAIIKSLKIALTVGNGESVSAKAVGQARLVLEKNYLLLDNVYLIPAIRRNLIFISELCR